MAVTVTRTLTGLPVGLDVGEVDRRPEVLGAQPADVGGRDVPDLLDVAQLVGDHRVRRGWLMAVTGDRARVGVAVLRRDEARVEQRRERRWPRA